jgi:ABC-type lipoprotein release transport system permease subunit
VYALVVFLLASVLLFTAALRSHAAALLADAPDVVVQRMSAGRHELVPAAYLEPLGGMRGVSSARGRLWGYLYDPVARANYTIVVPERAPGAPGEAILGASVARLRGVAPGAPFLLRTYDGGTLELVVKQVLGEDAEPVAGDTVVVGEADFRALFGTPEGTYTDLALAVANPREVRTVASKATALLADTRAITRPEMIRTYEAIFDWRSGLLVVVIGVSGLAFLVLAWDKASGLSAEERRELGVLKAIGWDASDVLLLRFWEGAAVSLVAWTAGVLLAHAHVFLAGAPIFRPVLEGWSTLRPALRLVPSAGAFQLATLFLLTVVPYTVATLVPAWRAATTDPDAVMRS